MTYFHRKLKKNPPKTPKPPPPWACWNWGESNFALSERELPRSGTPRVTQSLFHSSFCQPRGTEAQNRAASLCHRDSCHWQLGCPQQQVWIGMARDDSFSPFSLVSLKATDDANRRLPFTAWTYFFQAAVYSAELVAASSPPFATA